MTLENVAGVLLLVAPVWFTVTFTILGRTFDYPDILRRSPDEVLSRFRAGGAQLLMQWWAFMFSGIVFLPAAVLLSTVVAADALAVMLIAIAVAILAAVVQIVGLLRWVYLVPYLARMHASPESSPTTREAVTVVFQAFHRFLGVGVGEHLGYLFTGAWTLLVGIMMVLGVAFPGWLGWVGVLIGAGLVLGSAEFLGPNEEKGWSLAGKVVPILYVVWSLWLVGAGLTLLLRR